MEDLEIPGTSTGPELYPQIAVPEMACRDVKRAEENPGSTTTAHKPPTFTSLGHDILLEIMEHLHRDPVSQICLSLTSRYFQFVFHRTVDIPSRFPAPPLHLKWVLKYKPLAPDLRCQVSVCGTYTLYGPKGDFDYIKDATDVQWKRSLGESLKGEDWVWRGTRECKGCRKLKMEGAYASHQWEEEMLKKHDIRIYAQPDLRIASSEFSETWCARCRAAEILVVLEGREEHFELSDSLRERESLGLRGTWKHHDSVWEWGDWKYVAWKKIWGILGI